MSQSSAKPHYVKVYGYKYHEGEARLAQIGQHNFESKCAAERFASEQRKDPEVSSAVVYPNLIQTATA